MAPRAVGLALLASVTAVAFAGCASADTASSLDTPISAESTTAPSPEETMAAAAPAAPAEESDQERIWRTCYDPTGQAADVNTNPAIVDSVLSDYPPEWSTVAPVPTAEVAGVCRQQLPTTGVPDTYYVHFADIDAGYRAAVEWAAQLESAGAVGGCRDGLDLTHGASEIYYCDYTLPNGYNASIKHAYAGVDLKVQGPVS